MKKRIFLLAALLFLFSGCTEESPKIETGWSYAPQGVYYLDGDGVPVTGWQTVDGSRRYFQPDRGGAMAVGWLELPRGRYCFDSNGVPRTGWAEIDGQRYYFHPDGVMAVGTVDIGGVLHHFTSSGQPFLLVNREYPLPEGFQPELVEVEGFLVAEACAEELVDMMMACRGAAHRCVINTAYRDVDFQKMLWENRYNSYIAQGYSPEEAADLSARIVLPPGSSEHHTGLAVDITGTEEMYDWLERNAPRYGFILRYPADKQQWTGVSYEPWHFRYVGRALAMELQELKLTPEEYLYRLTGA